MDLNKVHKSIWDWLFNGDNNIYHLYAIIGQYDKDGSIKSNDNAIIFLPDCIGKADKITDFIDGSCELEYTFTLTQYINLNVIENDDVNIKALEFFESVADWIEENKETLEIANCQVLDLNILTGYISGIDMAGAKLQIPIKIELIGE